MAYDIFKKYGLDKIHDSLTEDMDSKDVEGTWELVKTKSVMDSDGFMTEYSWFTNGDKHIFMFGDSDLYEPDEDYADWVTESEKEAEDWFTTYEGFADEDDNIWDMPDEDVDDNYSGNANFMNDGFNRAYNIDGDLED